MKNAYSVSKNEYLVEKIEGKLFCQCRESVYQGFPCRHEMSVCAQLLKDPKVLHFEQRWRKDYFMLNQENEENKAAEPIIQPQRTEIEEIKEECELDNEEVSQPKKVSETKLYLN